MGHLACLKALLEAPGIRVNEVDNNGYEGHTALTAAATSDPSSLRALLAVDGIDAAAMGNDRKAAIHWAAQNGSVECLRALLGAGGVDADQLDGCDPSNTALHCACDNAETDCIRALVATGSVDANRWDDESQNPDDKRAPQSRLDCG